MHFKIYTLASVSDTVCCWYSDGCSSVSHTCDLWKCSSSHAWAEDCSPGTVRHITAAESSWRLPQWTAAVFTWTNRHRERGGGIQTIYSKHLYRLLKSGRTGQLSTVRSKKKNKQNSSQVLYRPVRQNVQHARNVWGRRKGSFVHSDLWTVQTLHTLTKTVLLWWLFAVASSQRFVCRGSWFRRLSVQKRKHTRMNQCFPFQTHTKHPFQSVHGGALGVTLQNWEPFFHHWQDSKVLLMKFSRVKAAPSRLF